MLVRLFLLFTVVPVVELWLLIAIGRAAGAAPTLALVVATGAIGAALARHEGRRVLEAWRRAMSEGRMPEEGFLDGALILAGGVLLLTPGVVTDLLGLALLLRPTRRLAAGWARRRLEQAIARGTLRVTTLHGGPARPGPRGDATGRVVGSEDVPEGEDEPPSSLLH